MRRECLDHVVIFNEEQLRRVLDEYVQYFCGARPHQGVGQQIPSALGLGPPDEGDGKVVALLGGLHHDYRRAA